MKNVTLKNVLKRSLSVLLTFVFLFSGLNITALAQSGVLQSGTGGTTQATTAAQTPQEDLVQTSRSAPVEQTVYTIKFVHLDGTQTSMTDDVYTLTPQSNLMTYVVPKVLDGANLNDKTAQQYADASSNVYFDATATSLVNGNSISAPSFTLKYDASNAAVDIIVYYDNKVATSGSFTIEYAYATKPTTVSNYLTLPTTTNVDVNNNHTVAAPIQGASTVSYLKSVLDAGLPTYPVIDTSSTTDVYYINGTSQYKFYGWQAVSATSTVENTNMPRIYSDINNLETDTSIYLPGEVITITENTKLYPVFVSQYPVFQASKDPVHDIPDYTADSNANNDLQVRFYMLHLSMEEYSASIDPTTGESTLITFDPYDESSVGQFGNDEKKFAKYNQNFGAALKPGAEIYTHAKPIEVTGSNGLTLEAIQDADVIDEVLADPNQRPTDFDAITAYNTDRGYTSADADYLNPNEYGVFWYVAKVELDGYHIDGIIYKKSLINQTVNVQFYDVDGTTLLFEENVPAMSVAEPSIEYFTNHNNTAQNAAWYESNYPEKNTATNTYHDYDFYSSFTRYDDEAGYDFLGWYSLPQGVTPANPSDLYAYSTTNLSGIQNDIKLYARIGMEIEYNTNYPANTLTDDTFVKTDATGATVTYAPGTQDVLSETLTDTGFASPIGFDFAGWNTKADGSGTAIAEGANEIDLEAITGTGASINLPDSPFKLYAQWSALYPVTYDENIDRNYDTLLVAGDRSYFFGEYEYQDNFDILATFNTNTTIDQFNNPGYTLVGWRYIHEDANGVKTYFDYDKEGYWVTGTGAYQDPKTKNFSMRAGHVVLQARWQKNEFEATAPTIQRVYNSEAHSIDITTGAGFTATDLNTNSAITINSGDITVKAGSTSAFTEVGLHPVTFVIDLDNYVDDVEVVGYIEILPRPVSISVEEDSKTYNGLNGADPTFDFVKQGTDIVVTDALSTFTGTIDGKDYTTLPAEAKTAWPANVDMTTHFSGNITGGTITRVAETAGQTPEQYVKRNATSNAVEAYENVLTSLPTDATVANNNIRLVSVSPANFTINPIDVAFTALDYAAVYNQTQESDVTNWMAIGEGSSWMYEAIAGVTNNILTEDINTGILSAVTFDDTPYGALALLLSTAPAQGGSTYTDVFDITANTSHAAYGSYNFIELNGDLRVNTNGSINATPVDVTRVYNGETHTGSVNVTGLPSNTSYTVEYRVAGSSSNAWTATPSAINVDESSSYEFRVLASGYTTYYGTITGTRNDTVDVTITPRSLTATAQAVQSTYGDQDTNGIGAPALTAPVVEDKTPDSANATDKNYIDPAIYNTDIAAMSFAAQHTNVANEINARNYQDAITTSFTANPRGNYVVTEVDADHLVNKAALTITAANYEKDYLQLDSQAVAYNNGANAAIAASNGAFGYYVNTAQLKYSDSITSVEINRTNTNENVNWVNNAPAAYGDILAVGTIVGAISNARTPTPENSVVLTDNYTITTVEGDLLINPLGITVEAGDYTRRYGDDDSTITATSATAAWGSDLITASPFGYRVTGLPTGFSTGTTVAMQNTASTYVNAGTYTDHLIPTVSNIVNTTGVNVAANFVVTIIEGDFIITQRDFEVTAGDYTRIYGNADISAVPTSTMGMPANTTLTAATSGAFGYYISSGDILASDLQYLEVTVARTDAATDVDVNQYLGKLVAAPTSQNADFINNYNILTPIDGNFEITPRPITITAASYTKLDTDPDPTFTAAITSGQLVNVGDLGTIGAQRVAGFIGNPLGLNVNVLEPTYTVQNGNYIVTLVNGNLTINTIPAPIPIPPTPIPTPPTPTPPTPTPPTLPDPPTFEIPDTEPPTAATIEETELPLAPGSPAWALLNLILTLATAFISVVLLVNYFGKKKQEEENRNNTENAQATQNQNIEQEKEEVKRKGLLRLASLIPAIVAVIVFILTEDMTLPMTIVDEWTWLMALIAFAQVVVASSSKKQINNEDDDDEVYAN